MKWFKHDTDCDESEGLSFLLDQEGFSGYGRWFRLLEIVASKMDKSDRCYVEYPAKKWGTLLGLKQKKLKTFLELCENKLKTKVVCYDNIIKIEIPNLLKKRDDYSRKSEQEPDKVTPRSKMVDTDIDKRNKTFSSDSDEIRLSELLLSFILARKPDHKKPNIQSWAKEVDLMIRIDKRNPETIEAVISWCQSDSFWQNNILSTAKLRKQFDALDIKRLSGGNGNGLQISGSGRHRESWTERVSRESRESDAKVRAKLGIGGGYNNSPGKKIIDITPRGPADTVDSGVVACVGKKVDAGGE